MKLIVKHFPKHHRYHKIFYKNTIKLSYSRMQNMGNVITNYNNKLLFQIFEQPTRMCNCRGKACRDKASRPMNGNYLQQCFVCKQTAQIRESTTLGRLRMNLKPGITIIPCHSEIKVLKRKLNFQNMFGNSKRRVKILPSNRVLLQKPHLIYAGVNAVTYA